jgi:hypothetical protein
VSEPNSGPPIELPTTGQVAEVAALVEAEAVAQDAIADNLVEQILLVWFAFAALPGGGGARPGSQFYDGTLVSRFGLEVSRLVIAAQQAAGQTTEAYLREQFERMGEDLPRTTLVDLPEDLRLGAATDDVYQRPIRQIRYWQSVEEMPLEEAVSQATDRLERQAGADLQLARVTASQQLFFATNPKRITGWRRIIHPELGNVCGLCIAASDRIYRRIERMSMHPGCVLEGTEVAASGVRALTRRRYAGPVIILHTRSGKELRITPNHPVLTDHGWVRADGLRQGDRVVRHNGFQGVVGRSPDEVDRPARVEDVWRSLTVREGLLPRSVPLAAEDFHGDVAGERKVDVVLPDRHLASVGDVSFVQPCSELSLVGAQGGRVGFASEGSRPKLFGSLWFPENRSVRGGSDSLSLARNTLIAQQGSLATRSRLYTRLQQTTSNHRARYAESFRQVQLRFAGSVRLDNFSRWNGAVSTPPRFDPMGDESTVEGRRSYAVLGGQLIERLSGQIEFDEIVDLDRVDFSGHVYNLETREGWYDASSIVVSNCKCTTMPVTADQDPGRDLNAEDLGRIYAAAGSTSTEALREIRVEVRQNGELGDIIIPESTRMKGPQQVTRQLSDRAQQLRREQIERQIAQLRARPRRSQWFDDRILQLEELLETA